MTPGMCATTLGVAFDGANIWVTQAGADTVGASERASLAEERAYEARAGCEPASLKRPKAI